MAETVASLTHQHGLPSFPAHGHGGFRMAQSGTKRDGGFERQLPYPIVEGNDIHSPSENHVKSHLARWHKPGLALA